VRRFIGAAQQRDDICLVCLGRNETGTVSFAMPTVPLS
jgi:hypothetical protein